VFKSDFTRKELFAPFEVSRAARTDCARRSLYQQPDVCGVGYMIELQSGKAVGAVRVRDRILQPLDMKSTSYTISEMVKNSRSTASGSPKGAIRFEIAPHPLLRRH